MWELSWSRQEINTSNSKIKHSDRCGWRLLVCHWEADKEQILSPKRVNKFGLTAFSFLGIGPFLKNRRDDRKSEGEWAGGEPRKTANRQQRAGTKSGPVTRFTGPDRVCWKHLKQTPPTETWDRENMGWQAADTRPAAGAHRHLLDRKRTTPPAGPEGVELFMEKLVKCFFLPVFVYLLSKYSINHWWDFNKTLRQT